MCCEYLSAFHALAAFAYKRRGRRQNEGSIIELFTCEHISPVNLPYYRVSTFALRYNIPLESAKKQRIISMIVNNQKIYLSVSCNKYTIE